MYAECLLGSIIIILIIIKIITYEFEDYNIFINLEMIYVFNAFGVPSSPCIRLANNNTVFSNILGTFSSTSLSTKSINIVFLPNTTSIPSVY